MADEVVAAPVAEPAPVEAPVVAPEPVATPEPAPAETPAAPALHTDTPDLLATPPAESKKDDKPAEAAPVAPEVTAEPAVKYEFKFPEAIKPDAARVEALSTLLGGAKVDAETAQKLVDMHTEVMQQYASDTLTRQHQVFGEMRAGWRQQIMADPVLGGAGFETAKRGVMEAIDLLVPEAHRKDFNEWKAATGSGDHIAVWRILHNAYQLFREPAPVHPGTPVADQGRRPKDVRAAFFTHPTSKPG